MYRRIVAVFFSYCLFVSILVLHLGLVSIGKVPSVQDKSDSKGISLPPERANIFDSNGEKLTNCKENYYAAIKPTKEAADKIKDFLDAKDFEKLQQDFKKQKPVIQKVNVPYIKSNDILVFSQCERYTDGLLSHIIGYVNYDGNGVAGVEKSFDELLKKNSRRMRVIFPSGSGGKVIRYGDIILKTDSFYEDSGVYLTIDKRIQEIAEECMDNANIDLGAMVVLEARTGKIRAMVSRPNFDPNNIKKSLDDKNSPFLNRALCQFSVGSVFKPAIAACALEQNIDPYIMYSCTGKIKVKNVEFGCYNRTSHGVLDMQGALEESCNCYFINLINKMDMSETISTLSAFGFGKEIKLCDGIVSQSGVLPSEKELLSPAAKSNFSFGQGVFMATPLQISACMSVFASGGELYTPYLIEKTIDKDEINFMHKEVKPLRVISKKTADLVCKFLQSAVENGNGRGAKLIYTTSAGKTATAQTGAYKNGKEIYNTWFSGFFPVENPKYVVTVIKEDGSLGASDCAPVFKMFADSVLKMDMK